jgi:hypothetical protein
MDKQKKLIVIPLLGAIVLVIALGLMAFTNASAPNTVLSIQAQDDDSEDPIPWKGESGGFRGMKSFGHGRRIGFGASFDYETFIAEELGVSVAELQAARQAAQEAALDQAVAEGVLTAEQAELIKAGQALKQYIDHQEILSQALGIDAADLEAAREEGKSLPYLFGELGLEPEEIRAALQSAYEDVVQQAVDDGVITESQAELLKERGLGNRGFGKGGFGFHERGGFHFQRPAPSTDNDI